MNWVGGSKTRNGLVGQNGDIQRRYLRYAPLMEEDEQSEESSSQRERVVPLLQYMKDNFRNGDALAVQLRHQMEITKTHYVPRGSEFSSQNTERQVSQSDARTHTQRQQSNRQEMQNVPSTSTSAINIGISSLSQLRSVHIPSSCFTIRSRLSSQGKVLVPGSPHSSITDSQSINQNTQTSKKASDNDNQSQDQHMASQNVSSMSSDSGIRYSPLSEKETQLRGENDIATPNTDVPMGTPNDDGHSLANNAIDLNINSPINSQSTSSDSEPDVAPTPRKVMRMEIDTDLIFNTTISTAQSEGIFQGPNISNLPSFRLLKAYESESECCSTSVNSTQNNNAADNSKTSTTATVENSKKNHEDNTSEDERDNDSKITPSNSADADS